jgi:hypothetical protein
MLLYLAVHEHILTQVKYWALFSLILKVSVQGQYDNDIVLQEQEQVVQEQHFILHKKYQLLY